MELLAFTAITLATMSLVGLLFLYLFAVRPLQARVEEQAAEAAQQYHQLKALAAQHEADADRRVEQVRAALEGRCDAFQQEVDYLKSQLSMLLTPPETPPSALPALASGQLSGASPAVAPPPHPFENQRVSDILARYQGRLRRGHIDALTKHFSLNPNGLFLELDERGERLIFPGQEVIYGSDFQQNYSFAYDCEQPGGGYVVVVSPARLDAQGNIIARGRLRVE